MCSVSTWSWPSVLASSSARRTIVRALSVNLSNTFDSMRRKGSVHHHHPGGGSRTRPSDYLHGQFGGWRTASVHAEQNGGYQTGRSVTIRCRHSRSADPVDVAAISADTAQAPTPGHGGTRLVDRLAAALHEVGDGLHACPRLPTDGLLACSAYTPQAAIDCPRRPNQARPTHK